MGSSNPILLLNFAPCMTLSDQKGKGANQVLNLVTSTGGRVLRVEEGGILTFHPDPIAEMNDDGSFLVHLEFEHRLLARSTFDQEDDFFEGFHPVAGISYLRQSKDVVVHQVGDATNPQNLDSLAKGQLKLGKKLYPYLRPMFGYIDQQGANEPIAESMKNTELTYILWANFYGPPHVKKYGRACLLRAP